MYFCVALRFSETETICNIPSSESGGSDLIDSLSNCFNYLKSFSSLRSAVAEECGIGATWRKRKVQS